MEFPRTIEQAKVLGARKRGNPNFYKGMPAPPKRTSATWQPPAQRAEYLVAKYGSDEIIAMAKLIAAGKKSPLSSQDCVVCIQLANIYELRDGAERERLYDRTFGKVPDRAININLNLDSTPEQMSERALALLGELLPAEAIDTESECDLIEE